MRRSLSVAVLLSAFAAVPAHAADTTFTIRGAGFGHGVGMSQYGALGAAQKGWNHRQILGHYYSGTAIGQADSRKVRVLLATSRTATFSGATSAGGRRLRADRVYGARARGAAVDLVNARGKRLKTVAAPLVVKARTPIALRNRGTYRGALEFRPNGSNVDAINAVGLESYVKGVVPVESPASWPLEALKAQAVAARTYAITTSKPGAGYDQYADTRSQVYGGVNVEQPSSNQAVSETKGEVVTYQGSPVVTFFFSTSGGRTEAVENTTLGTRPLPWLKSVDDPFDSVSPKHRWGPIRMSLGSAGRKLGSLVKGRFRGIEVVARGASPRIVAADVVGTGGRTRVNGATLRARFGLMDSWAYFTSISTGEEEEPAPDEEEPEEGPPTGGAGPASASAARQSSTHNLAGHIIGARKGAKAVVEIDTMVGWRRAGTATIRRGGAYRFGLCTTGTYRVRVGKATGPVVRVPKL
ncbi:MAG TPA: SpoIID/LytB domain-containing protein [Solirubrobacteraceae bacterium]